MLGILQGLLPIVAWGMEFIRSIYCTDYLNILVVFLFVTPEILPEVRSFTSCANHLVRVVDINGIHGGKCSIDER